MFGEKRFALAAASNLTWVISQQQPNGWFDHCGFNQDPPNMHVISYTLRGLLECEYLKSYLINMGIATLDLLPHLLPVAGTLSEVAANRPLFGITGMLPSSFDRYWQSSDKNSCLTGNLQFACFLYRLQYIRNGRYNEIADMILAAVQGTQLTGTDLASVDGAIAGSYPIYSGYLSLAYPNWATKFLVDAIILKQQKGSAINIPA